MVIDCITLPNFYDTIEELVKRGLLFEADRHDYTIKLTGGY